MTRGAQTVNGVEPVEELCPRAAGLWGLASVIAIEQPDLKVRIVDLDPGEAADERDGAFNRTPRKYAATRCLARRPAMGFSAAPLWPCRCGARQKNRMAGRSASNWCGRALSTVVELRPCPSASLRPDEVRLRVLAAGINFRDVLLALGMYPGADVPLGAECAGVITEVGTAVTEFKVGDRVLGFAPASLATEAIVPAAFLAPLPKG